MFKKRGDSLYEWIETFVVVIVLVIIIRTFIGEPRFIPSASMKPTLIEGDRVFVEKISGFFTKPKRGDIVVFYPPFEKLSNHPWAIFTRLCGLFNKDIAYIKRIVGMPGETIEIKVDPITKNATVFINGKALDEDYKYSAKSIECKPDMYCGPVKIPENSYFMMGDNRANSQDSRFWGFLPEERIIGKAQFIFWPLNRLQIFETKKY